MKNGKPHDWKRKYPEDPWKCSRCKNGVVTSILTRNHQRQHRFARDGTCSKYGAPMIWTLEEAIPLCQTIERAVAPVGFHVGIRGSVLMKGSSENDLDLVLYPHDSTLVCFSKIADLYAALYEVGLVQIKTTAQVHAWWRSKGSSDKKDIEIWGYGDRKVDILFALGAQ